MRCRRSRVLGSRPAVPSFLTDPKETRAMSINFRTNVSGRALVRSLIAAFFVVACAPAAMAQSTRTFQMSLYGGLEGFDEDLNFISVGQAPVLGRNRWIMRLGIFFDYPTFEGVKGEFDRLIDPA